MIYFFIVSVSFITVYLLTPTIRHIGLKLSAVDKKNSRKIHTKNVVVKFGGIGIYLGFLAGVFIYAVFDHVEFKFHFIQISGLLLCATLALFLGMYDDLQGSNAQIKFIVQTFIALLLMELGFKIKRIFFPGLLDIPLGIFSIPITILWLVGVMNAINLLDGLDGLAAGLISISLLFLSLYGYLCKENFFSCIALALFGASFAFLKYNFYPAKIFMGDSGSLFLGCMVAGLGAYSAPNGEKSNQFLLPTILLLFLPILDTTIAVIRRILRRQHIFTSDACHIHHYFLKKGFIQTQTVIGFYICTIILGLISLGILAYK